MNQNIEQKQNEQGTQTKNLEMPTSMRMLDLSKNYLSSIEKKFGAFLAKLGINPGNYDGKLSGNNTGAEKMYQEKILPLQKKIEKEKDNLKKQDIMMQLTQAVLQARGIDMGSIEKLARQEGKEKEFQKASSELLGNDEYKDLEKKLSEQVNKLDDVYIVNGENERLDIEKLKKDLISKNNEAIQNYNSGKISKDIYESTINNNIIISKANGIELEVTKGFGDTINKLYEGGKTAGELGMRSGVLPIAMMITPIIKKGVPLLPTVIGVGIYARLLNTLNSDKISTTDKALETGKVVGHTALSIAPITGSIIATKDAYNSWEKVKNGTGTKGEAIADTLGAGVSIIFDGVTIVMAATGVGAVPAAGVATSRKAAVEGAKFGLKKLISKAGKLSDITADILTNAKNATKALVGYKSVEETIVKEGTTELIKTGRIISAGRSNQTMKETWGALGKDTLKSVKDVLTFKGTRDTVNNLMFKTPKFGEWYKNMRPSKFYELKGANLTNKANSGNNDVPKDLQYIDSKKHSLEADVTKELVDILDGKILEYKELTKKYENLKTEIEVKRSKNEDTTNIERELETTEVILYAKKPGIYKALDTLDKRAQDTYEKGSQTTIGGNERIWSEMHENFIKYLSDPSIDSRMKSDIIKGLRPTSIDKHGYLKDSKNGISKFADDIINRSDGFNKKADDIILLAEKGLTGKLNLKEKAKQIIEEELKGADIIRFSTNINQLFDRIPELKYDRDLINSIRRKYENDFTIITPGTEGQHVEGISFMSEMGILQDIISKNRNGIKGKLESYIFAIKKDDYHTRGAINMGYYFAGTDLDKTASDQIKLVFGKKFKIPKEHSHSHSDNLRKIQDSIEKNEFNVDRLLGIFQEIGSIDKKTGDISTVGEKKVDQISFSHKELITFFEKNKELLAENNVVLERLKSLFNNENTNKNTQNVLGKLISIIDTKSTFSISATTPITRETIIQIANSHEIPGSSLNILVTHLTSAHITGMDYVVLVDSLINQSKRIGNHGKNEEKKFQALLKNALSSGEIDKRVMDTMSNSGEMIKHFTRLAERLNFELKSDYKNGEGLYLFSKDTGGKIRVDMSSMTNMKTDLINLVISNSTLTNSKYHENVGMINYIASKTKFHDKINSSDNIVFQNILDFNRSLESFVKYNDESKQYDFFINDEKLSKLLGEYRLEDTGDRFIKKVILANKLIEAGKSKMVIESLKVDISKAGQPDIALSLIHNIQNPKVKAELFGHFITENSFGNEVFQHSLFRKLANDIDNITLNTGMVDIVLSLKKELLLGDSLQKLDGIISIVQDSKNIEQKSIDGLITMFKEIQGKISSINSDHLNEKYLKILIELARIEKVRDYPDVMKVISSNVQNRHVNDPLFKEAAMLGQDILRKYHNIDQGRKIDIKDLYKVDEKIKEVLRKGFEKGKDIDIQTLLGTDISKALSHLKLTPVKVDPSTGELMVRYDNTGKEVTFHEYITYQKAIRELSRIQKDFIGTKGSDVIYEHMEEYKTLYKKIGFDIVSFSKFFVSNDSDKLYKLDSFGVRDNETRDVILAHGFDNSIEKSVSTSVRAVESNEQNKNFKDKVAKNAESIQWTQPEVAGNMIPISELKVSPEVKQKTLEIFGKEINLKTVLGILITFGIMTPTEAQAAAQDIEQSWKSSPEFKKFNELGGEKSAEAMKIREETVKRLAGEKLKPFIEGFDERIRDRNREKVASYPATIQVILSTAYEKGFPLIQDKSQRNLNIFNGGLITYIDQVYNGTGKAEQAAQNLLKRFPEFEGTQFQRILIDNGKAIDNLSGAIERTQKRNEIINMLKKI